MNIFRKILGKRIFLGVDIGTTSIKIVELSKRGNRAVLENYGVLESYEHLDRPNNALQTSGLKMLEREAADMLISLTAQMNVQSTDVIASLPSFMSFTALLDIPLLSSEETAQAMEFQARSYIPFPLSEASTEWIPVGEYVDEKGNKNQHILVISIPNENVEKYKNIFKLAGLNLRALEVEGASLARALTSGDPTLSLIIDIGARSTAISVAQKGILTLCRQTDYAGASLTQALAGGLHINAKRAEILKKKFGLSGKGGEYEMATLMLPFLDLILGEGERVCSEYEKNYHQKIERVILSGGGSNLIGIEKYASDFFKLPAVKAHPFASVSYPQGLEPLISQIGGPFSVAFGLGMKEFI